MNKRKVVKSCYFRTLPSEGKKKVFLQITERCNLRCVHCFVNSNGIGLDMTYENFEKKVLPYLKAIDTERVTITGGEPFVHKDIFKFIDALTTNFKSVTVCTNGTLIDEYKLKRIAKYSNLKFNVSIDGFSDQSHNQFRGQQGAFKKTKEAVEKLSNMKKLGGILVTPNSFSDVNEYVELCLYARSIKAKYVLFNPLSKMGRGRATAEKYGMSDEKLLDIKIKTISLTNDDFEVVYCNFPGTKNDSSEKCPRQYFRYIYANGDVVVCPYLDFYVKAKNAKNIFKDNQLGNILDNPMISDKLKLKALDACVAFNLQLKDSYEDHKSQYFPPRYPKSQKYSGVDKKKS